MMAGSIFLFCTWFLWIFTTFFMDKRNQKRTEYSIYLLLAIILSELNWEWQHVRFSILPLVVLVISFFYTSRLHWKKSMYCIVSSFFVMLAYITYELMAIIDPIWVFIPGVWLKASVLFILVILLHRNIVCQILILSIGSMMGDIVLSFVLRSYQMNYSIGSIHFFDSFMLGMLGMISLFYLKMTLARWEQYVFMLEKERKNNV